MRKMRKKKKKITAADLKYLHVGAVRRKDAMPASLCALLFTLQRQHACRNWGSARVEQARLEELRAKALGGALLQRH